MQHVHRIRQSRCVNHAKSTRVVPHPNLLNTFADGGHRFEVIGPVSVLNTVKLTTRILSCIARKFTQTLKQIAEELDELSLLDYSDLDIFWRVMFDRGFQRIMQVACDLPYYGVSGQKSWLTPDNTKSALLKPETS